MQWSAVFDWGGLAGNVSVECIPNESPEGYGCWWPNAHGYPVCTASVEYPGRGYPAMFGWVQLVRSTDNDSGGGQFEIDPFALFGDAPSPYCWYGIEPTLFDAPSRPETPPSEWVAHSFLATTPLAEVIEGNPRRVVPVLGFAWGFDERAGSIELRHIAQLATSDWDAHLPVLRASYPRWTFTEHPSI
jgi:hypothetical protein